MKILTSHPLSVAPIAGRIPFPGHSLTLVAKGLFRLDEGRVRELLEGEELSFPTGDIPAGEDEDEAGEIRYANDFAFYKPRTDLILVGRCHPPGDEAVGSCRVGFQVGDHARSLQVFGDRWWAGEGVGHRMTEPHPFTEMELSWERAYGGVESPDNPVGRGDRPITLEDGRQAWPLPNIESPRQLVQSPDERPTPAGFGPIPLTWEPRRSRSGTYDDAWLESRWPWFPEDLDWSLFNAAAPDMQPEGFLKGNEEVHLENLRPGEPDFRTRLPGLRVRCFLNVLPEGVEAPPSTEKARQDWTPPPREEMEFREVPVKLDTLWVDAEEGLLALVWRGYTPVRTEEFDEVRHLYLHVEALEDDPAGLDACRAAFWTLLDEEEGGAADEPDLIDALAEPEGADPASDPASDPAEEEEPEDEEDLEIDLPFDPMEKLRADMEAMGIDPDNPPEPTPEEMEAAKAYFRAEGRDDLVALLEMSEEDDEEDEEASPPPWSRERVVELHAQGEPLEDADLRGLDLSGLELPGLEALEADFTGANLSGTDLSDAQLSAAMLSGADLSGTRLQGATLAGCDLTEARISKAVLAEADLSGSRLDQADLRGADLTDALLDDCRMTGADLTGVEAADAVFTGADLSDALLLRGHFKGADFTGAKLDRVDAREAVFESAEFGQVSAVEGMFASADMTELRAADALDFTGANLSQVQARESVWSGATLERAVLAWAMLEGADFTGANLRGSDFYAAHLKGARFAKADLLDARLATADAFEASFEKADLARADLRGGNFYGAEFLDARFWETATEGANFRMTKYG